MRSEDERKTNIVVAVMILVLVTLVVALMCRFAFADESFNADSPAVMVLHYVGVLDHEEERVQTFGMNKAECEEHAAGLIKEPPDGFTLTAECVPYYSVLKRTPTKPETRI